MNAQQMWDAFTREKEVCSEYDAWAFGDDPDKLAELVDTGIKTATASAYPIYELEGEDLPTAGDYSVILNSDDEAVCIIQTTKVFVMPFCDIGEQQAWKEGEGDRSLAYWRQVHERFFRNELAQAGLTFEESMKVVCEEFIKVYP